MSGFEDPYNDTVRALLDLAWWVGDVGKDGARRVLRNPVLLGAVALAALDAWSQGLGLRQVVVVAVGVAVRRFTVPAAEVDTVDGREIFGALKQLDREGHSRGPLGPPRG